MRYLDAAQFLFRLRQYEMRPGTNSTASLLAELGNPHLGPSYIQIAGSNGKGSTARMCESILREAGLNVGLYTSPHIEFVRDRITINGQPIPKQAVVSFVESISDRFTSVSDDGTSATYFEVITALALWYFGTRDVDVAILEVGIGGPKDATSVVDPTACAVTTISLEHTDILGDSIEEIAAEKAKIAPANRPLITGARGDALTNIAETADSVRPVRLASSPAHPLDDRNAVTVVSTAEADSPYSQKVNIVRESANIETTIPLLGNHQAVNAGIAVELCSSFPAVDNHAFERGLQLATYPGRFEIMNIAPYVILDGAHNPGACRVLADTLKKLDFNDLYVVFGAMRDKDIRGMLDALPTPMHITVCSADVSRAASLDLLESLVDQTLDVPLDGVERVEAALETTLQRAGPEDCILVTGSLATVREARHRWTRQIIPIQHSTASVTEGILRGADVPVENGYPAGDDVSWQLVQTTLRPRDAQWMQALVHRIGGKCFLSGLINQDEQPIDVVIAGTDTHFRTLTLRLERANRGLSHLASQLRQATTPNVERWPGAPAIMGILNVTPDSFHDGGSYDSVSDAVAQAEAMVDAGAAIIDIGGESTRPGADPVPPEEEQARILPVIDELSHIDASISIDTRRSGVAAAALDAGADIVNDVSGLADPTMASVVADANASLVLMHSLDAPVIPNRYFAYDNVVHDVARKLTDSVLRAEREGLTRDQIIIDPGLGFGKSPWDSFALLGRVGEFRGLGCPILIGHSHKSMFDAIEQSPDDRLSATIAGTTIAADRGADIIRVHDVPENVAAVEAVRAVNRITK